MAENSKNPKLQNQTTNDTRLFIKGMTKDPNASIVSKEQWTHARNAINNSDKGDLGTLGNEPSNLLCSYTNYPVIGTIHLYGDKWVIFSTDDIVSEIGLFDDSKCEYTQLVNDGAAGDIDDDCPPERCLNFNSRYLITGASKENFDCTWQIYWDDGRNPSRTLNLTNIPWKSQRIVEGDCVTYVPFEPKTIDCEKIRLAPLLDTPKITLTKSDSGGQLRNGSYQVFLAYTMNGQQIGDWIGVSNVQPLFDHSDTVGCLDIKFSNVDKGEFEEFKLAILSNNQSETQAKELGLYSVETTHISVSYINQELPTVPIEFLPLRTPAYEKSDKMYVVNDYLIRSGPTERFDFNYQPLANQISTYFTVTAFPADYYAKGGNKPTFMRDEVYAFFIRWVYDTGEKSSSYHIPGRPASDYTVPDDLGADDVRDLTDAGDINNLPDNDGNLSERIFETHNTAGWSTNGVELIGTDDDGDGDLEPYRTHDGGFIYAMGRMAYWESTERYPMDPVRWNANIGDPDLDLCGQPIRHHKFPDEQTACPPQGGGPLARNTNDNQWINVLGVKFGNIPLPVLNAETVNEWCTEPTEVVNLVPGIVGYEILVGSRDGNKSIIAKGLARNMREYRLPPDTAGNENSENTPGNVTGVMANYPFNDLGCDPFLHDTGGDNPPRWAYKDSTGVPYSSDWNRFDMFTFHSPDTSIDRPFLNPWEIKSYGVTVGKSIGIFKKSEEHPGQKLLKDIAAIIACVIGAGYAVAKTRGHKRVKFDYYKPKMDQITLGLGSTNAVSYGTALGGSPLAVGAMQVGAGVSESVHTGSAVAGAPGIGQQAAQIFNLATSAGAGVAGLGGGYSYGNQVEFDRKDMWYSELPALFQPFYGVFAFIQSIAEGGNHIIELIYNLCSYVDYAYKYNGHGLYSRTFPFRLDESSRARVDIARYVKNTMTMLSSGIKMNNLYRPNTVAIVTEGTPIKQSSYVDDGGSVWMDNSRVTIPNCYFPSNPFLRNVSAHYVGLKMRFTNQYGQLDQITQIPITNGEWGSGIHELADVLDTDDNGVIIPPDADTRLWSLTLYGGDCYINRYTEKNVMPFFWDFLKGQPDGFPYDYRLRANVMYPMYWANFLRYDLSALSRWVTNLDFFEDGAAAAGVVPSGMHYLDRCRQTGCGSINPWSGSGAASYAGTSGLNLGSFSGFSLDDDDFFQGGGGPVEQDSADAWVNDDDPSLDPSPDGRGVGLFHIKDGYFYTHNSGIQDFFVESEYNVALRDWEDNANKRHYDWLEYTDVNSLFHADHILSGNFYKYDKALNITQMVTSRISSGDIQPRYYDPHVAETCWTHYPKRLIYSLQAQKEATKDYWRVFLPNNYKDFKNKVNVIKPISKSGAVILFPHLSPVSWQGVDVLQTDLGTKVTIGDGGLFSQPQQNIVNADLSHEYGSCESSRSVINTPSGLYYISQAQGKIFQLGQGLINLADAGMKQWFNEYLPSQLMKQFPEIEKYPHWSDNPVAGVGCQSVYDPNYDIVYFCKKDYVALPTVTENECIEFVPEVGFVFNNTRCSEDGTLNETGENPPTTCCPEGFFIIPQLSTSRCASIDWQPVITESDTSCNDPIDIIFVMEGSARINNLNGAKETMKATVTNIIQGLIDRGQWDGQETNNIFMPGGINARGMALQYSEIFLNQNSITAELNPNSIGYWQQPIAGYTDWAYTGGTLMAGINVWFLYDSFDYDDPTYGQAVNDSITYTPQGSNPAAGFWHALDKVFTSGRDMSKKYIIQLSSNYTSNCMECQAFEPLTSQIQFGCDYPGFSSPASELTPATPPMVNVMADNPGQPGSLSYYRGLNEWNIDVLEENTYDTEWGNSANPNNGTDFAMFPRPVCSPQEQGYNDTFITWLNDNVFNNPRYNDPNDPDYKGSVEVINLFFAPWNGIVGLGSDHPFDGDQVTQGNQDYTIARSSSAVHAIWGSFDTPQNQNNTAEGMAEQVLNIIDCNNSTGVYDYWTCDCEQTNDIGQIVSGSGRFEIGAPYPEIANGIIGLDQTWTNNLTGEIYGQTGDVPTSGIYYNESGQPMCMCMTIGGTPEDVNIDGSTFVIDGQQSYDDYTPIPLTDTNYFADISWTVSYDPKANAWISFHDWHPELTMPSLNHFLTTKSKPSEDPVCPPGFTFDPDVNGGSCVQYEQNIEDADIIVLDTEPTITYGNPASVDWCPADIVFALDMSRSMLGNSQVITGEFVPGPKWENTLWFVDTIVETLSDAITDGDIQIAVWGWSSVVFTGEKERLDLTNDVSAIRNFLGIADGFTNPDFGGILPPLASTQPDPDGDPIITDDNGTPINNSNERRFVETFGAIKCPLDYIITEPNAGTNLQGNSYLGSRQGDQNFQRVGIVVTDIANPEHVDQVQTNCNFYAMQNELDPIMVQFQEFGGGQNPNITKGSDLVNSFLWETGTMGYWKVAWEYQNQFINATNPANNYSMRYFQDFCQLLISEEQYTTPIIPAFNIITDDNVAVTLLSATEYSDPSMNIKTMVAHCRYENDDDVARRVIFPLLHGSHITGGEDNMWSANPLTDFNDDGSLWYQQIPGIDEPIGAQTAQLWGGYYLGSEIADTSLEASSTWSDRTLARMCKKGETPATLAQCSCPPSATMVHIDYATGYFTSPVLPPTDDECNENNTICRSIRCECRFSEENPLTQVNSGSCPNVSDGSLFAIGDPDWENPNPPQCIYTNTCVIPPSYTKGSIWKHNVRCDSYANYYDQDYPWEIEWTENSGQAVMTLRSVEYQMESYIYKGALDNNCGDRFHDLDWNFDEAIIYNSEQVSGLLKLNLTPKNDVPLITEYPIVNGNDIEILYSKEEQKYRFNQFWDVTSNRGEYDMMSTNSIFLTQLNGYIRDLNNANLNYFKPALLRKKFRHYFNKVILRKNISGNRKMIMKVANTKLNQSHR